jgi:hypothetical protein
LAWQRLQERPPQESGADRRYETEVTCLDEKKARRRVQYPPYEAPRKVQLSAAGFAEMREAAVELRPVEEYRMRTRDAGTWWY